MRMRKRQLSYLNELKELKAQSKNQFYTCYAESFQLPKAIQMFKIHPLALEIYDLAQETFFLLTFKVNT